MTTWVPTHLPRSSVLLLGDTAALLLLHPQQLHLLFQQLRLRLQVLAQLGVVYWLPTARHSTSSTHFSCSEGRKAGGDSGGGLLLPRELSLLFLQLVDFGFQDSNCVMVL